VVVQDEQLRRALRFVVARIFGWTVAATAKRATSKKDFAERNEASPVIARSRLCTVREYQPHLTGIAKRQMLPHDGDCGL
jgi:hypothetical protein